MALSRSRDRRDRFVDHSALRTHQACVILMLSAAFILGSLPLVSFAATLLLIGVLMPDIAFFRMIYMLFLKPAGIVKPDVRRDNPEPYRFAQLIATALLVGALVLLGLDFVAYGWAVVWLVIMIAGLYMSVGVCVGSQLYYGLNRLGVPGFSRAPISGI